MKITTQPLLTSLFMLVLLGSCSRPVAYLQPNAREQFTAISTQSQPEAAVNSVAPVDAPEAIVQPTDAHAALDQVDAIVRNDTKVAADKTVQKRLNRVRSFLTNATTQANLTPTAVSSPKKMNLMERLMLKKLNKKISKQLAPANPNKPMANTGVLAAGAVLVILGLVLLIAGSSSTVSVILILAGAVVLLVGLL